LKKDHRKKIEKVVVRYLFDLKAEKFFSPRLRRVRRRLERWADDSLRLLKKAGENAPYLMKMRSYDKIMKDISRFKAEVSIGRPKTSRKEELRNLLPDPRVYKKTKGRPSNVSLDGCVERLADLYREIVGREPGRKNFPRFVKAVLGSKAPKSNLDQIRHSLLKTRKTSQG
jgi:hypothetical protein